MSAAPNVARVPRGRGFQDWKRETMGAPGAAAARSVAVAVGQPPGRMGGKGMGRKNAGE